MTTLLALLVCAQPAYAPNGPKVEFTLSGGNRFVITTDPKASPKTVQHVLTLVRRGFYDAQRVHRVESWVVQWGDPATRRVPFADWSKNDAKGNPRVGAGGSGRDLPFEESQIDFVRGVVGVASTGLQVGGDSQLFILKRDTLRLFRSYAVVGKVTEGMDAVGRIARGDRILRARVLP